MRNFTVGVGNYCPQEPPKCRTDGVTHRTPRNKQGMHGSKPFRWFGMLADIEKRKISLARLNPGKIFKLQIPSIEKSRCTPETWGRRFKIIIGETFLGDAPVAEDQLTRCWLAICKTAAKIHILFAERKYVCKNGLPKTITSDRGSWFIFKDNLNYSKHNNIKTRYDTEAAYNGIELVVRVTQSMKNRILTKMEHYSCLRDRLGWALHVVCLTIYCDINLKKTPANNTSD